MKQWLVKYCRIPTNYNDAANALIEAETAAAAQDALRLALHEGNGVRNYVIGPATEYVPVPHTKVLSLDHRS